MTITEVKTSYLRTVTVNSGEYDTFLKVGEHRTGKDIQAVLTPEESRTIAGALMGDNAVVITDLPEATADGYGYVESGNHAKHEDSDPETLEASAKKMLAIAKFIRKANAEKEAAAEAQKAKLTKRRDELAKEFAGRPDVQYLYLSEISRKAVDRVVELEEAK